MDQYVRDGWTWDPNDKVEDLYSPYVVLLLQSDAVALLLSFPETMQRNPLLPSWCPDLHYRQISDVLADHEGHHAGFNVMTQVRLDWDQYNKDPKTLRIKGIVMDTVKSVIEDEWETDMGEDCLETRPTSARMQKIIELMQKYTVLAGDFVSATELWRIFIGNVVGDEDSKLHLLRGFSSIHDRLVKRKWKVKADTLRSAYEELKSWKPEMGEPSAAIQQYLKNARKVCFGRRFFTSESGRIGFGPRSMMVGDVVCIFKKVKVPFVLQQYLSLPDTYFLKGKAYIHGLMYGEYLKVNKNFCWISMM
ncbi:hypothetical protein EK21DRAFT_109655 [Setomelanomma holmii]|uniref:Uncharacterized protein n=1 Tax=Setomelanomma holmii TaxID=210430 RepID=A0A9P4HE16_9PLEO|nr:hypothetical protein EK21DRAFT_109655 [Setomelanomma holmii]